MGKMKDTKVEQNINDVVMLTTKINGICKELKKENVFLRFEMNHSMSEDDTLTITDATQRINYLEAE
jgi:hypothetical protein|tara:strand:- start:310 stop:510 length:201 start_codon:yes stop_codon:yes gene_type:complete